MTVRVDSPKNWALLKDKILRHTPPVSGTYQTGLDGFFFHRHISNHDPKPYFYRPVIVVVVAQGKKWVRIGPEEYCFGEKLCFVTGLDMPASSCVMEAGEDRPYLSMSLDLDPGLIAELSTRVPAWPSVGALGRGGGGSGGRR